jgi:hypothetical protein
MITLECQMHRIKLYTMDPGPNVIKNVRPQFTIICSKLDYLSLKACLSSLVECLRLKPGALTRVEHLKAVLLR